MTLETKTFCINTILILFNNLEHMLLKTGKHKNYGENW